MTTHAQDRTEAAGRSYSGKTAQQRDSERRARLQEAALDLFGSQSFATTTVEELCGRAKVSTRHFYQIYDNKEALFAELYQMATDRSIEQSQAAYDRTKGLPIAERVGLAYLACVTPMIEDPRVARMVFVSAVGISPTLELKRAEFRDALIASFCKEAGTGTDLSDAELTWLRYRGMALAGATATIVYDWVVRSESETVTELEEMLSSIAVSLTAS